PLSPTLFPYTTLFRSVGLGAILLGLLVGFGVPKVVQGLHGAELLDGHAALVRELSLEELEVRLPRCSAAEDLDAGLLRQRTRCRSEEHTSELQSRGHL